MCSSAPDSNLGNGDWGPPRWLEHVSSTVTRWSLARLGEELGVTANTVRRYLLMAGVVMRSPNERRR